MLLMEFDKAGAEWVVVAYISGDARMIDVVESGKSPHVVTGSLISKLSETDVIRENDIVGNETDPDTILTLRKEQCPDILELSSIFLPRAMSVRQAGKRSNHGLNYGMKYKRFALSNEIEERDAKRIVISYTTDAYPGIVTGFWEPVRRQLKKDRTLINCGPFNRKVRLLNEWGDDLFNQGYSFIPQSTVVDSVNEAMCKAYEDTSPALYQADLLCQTHDSVTWQYPVNDWTMAAEFCIKFGLGYMDPELEYNFRKFHIGTDLKVGTHWGDSMIKCKLTPDVKQMSDNLKEAWNNLHERAGA